MERARTISLVAKRGQTIAPKESLSLRMRTRVAAEANSVRSKLEYVNSGRTEANCSFRVQERIVS